MSKKTRLELVSVPRPCSMPWESMTGTDKARTCAVCNRQVYDLAAMTSSEAERLLDCRDERLCIRFNRGPDGQIITADRLPKWSPPRRHFAGLSVAALAALMGVSQPRVALALTSSTHVINGRQATAVPEKQVSNKADGTLSGTIRDQGDGVIPNTEVLVLSESTGEEFTTRSGEDGKYRLPLPRGTYIVSVALPGFTTYAVGGVKVESGKGSTLDPTLYVGTLGEVVSISGPVPAPSLVRSFEHGTLVKVLTAPFRALKRLFGG